MFCFDGNYTSSFRYGAAKKLHAKRPSRSEPCQVCIAHNSAQSAYHCTGDSSRDHPVPAYALRSVMVAILAIGQVIQALENYDQEPATRAKLG